jgi:hypothetical protein
MSIAWVVENVLFPVAAALTNGEGLAVVSALHGGVAASSGPPALTRWTVVAAAARCGDNGRQIAAASSNAMGSRSATRIRAWSSAPRFHAES